VIVFWLVVVVFFFCDWVCPDVPSRSLLFGSHQWIVPSPDHRLHGLLKRFFLQLISSKHTAPSLSVV